MSVILLIAGHVMSIPTGPVTIQGTSRMVNPGWEVHLTPNGRAVFKCELLSEDGSYRPLEEDEIIITDDGDIEFGIDDGARRQAVHQRTNRPETGYKLDIASFNVRDIRVKLPQAIVACIRFELDCACVLKLTAGSRR